MDWKHKLAKLTSALLIALGIYQVIYSTNLLLFVYPNLKFKPDKSGIILYQSLIEKAIVYYISMIISSVYGIGLLFKPKEKLNYIQIIGGLIIIGLGIFFVTKTQITADPIFDSSVKLIIK